MKPKWIKGSTITDPSVAVSLIMSGRVIFDDDKPQNPGWTQNWSISAIKRAVALRRLAFAHPARVPAAIEQRGEAA